MTEAQKELPHSPSPSLASVRRRWLASLWVLLFTIALTVVAVVPFFFMGQNEDGTALGLRMPTTHDMFLHFDQMRSFYHGLTSGAVYPRWEEETNRGFGAPTMSYYPPGVYYVTSLCQTIAHDWTGALLWAHILMMLMSALAFYWYVRRLTSRGAAIIAMSAYVLGPYHLIDQYQRGAIAELLGFIWMPLMLGAGERLLNRVKTGHSRAEKGESATNPEDKNSEKNGRETQWRGKVWAVAILAMSYGAFIWSHPPTAYQFSLGFAVAMGVLALVRREWLGLVWIGMGLMLGVGLAAAYIVPAALEQNLIHKDYILGSWPYHNTYVFVHDIFNAKNFVDFYRRINWLWGLGLAFTLFCGVALLMTGNASSAQSDAQADDHSVKGIRRFFAFFERDGWLSAELKQRVFMWMILGLFVSFMMHKISKPIGQHIPRIEIGIFTWRMLAMSTLVTSLLAGACWQAASYALREQRKKATILFTTLSLAILIGGAAFSLLSVCLPMVKAPIFEPESEHLNHATLPATAPGNPEELPDDEPPADLAEDNGEVTVGQWLPEHRAIHAELTDDDQLWVRAFNFPGWTATVDGKPAEIVTGEELGDIEINLTAGSHDVRVDFLDTPIRRNAERASLVTFAFVLVMTLIPLLFRRNRRQPTS